MLNNIENIFLSFKVYHQWSTIWISWGQHLVLRAPTTSGRLVLSLNFFKWKSNAVYIVRAPTDFDISAHLNIPIFEAAPQISLKVSHSQGTVAGQTHSLSGSLAIKNNEVFSIKFLRTDVGEFDLSAATPLPQVSNYFRLHAFLMPLKWATLKSLKVSKLEFKHLHTPSSDATNGILNEYNLRWNDDNSVKLNYKTVR